MKNIILLLCDSLGYDKEFFDDMKFLQSIRANSYVFNNYFSKAPYTEAALNSLLTSCNTLDYNGYFNNIKENPITINEIFKDLGYKTFNTLWFYPNTKSFLRGVDEYLYVDLFSITYYLTQYRINYFKKIKEEEKMKENHYELIEDLLDDFFEMCKIYNNDFYNHKHRFNLLIKYTNFDYIEFEKKIIETNKENSLYFQNKKEYINKLLEEDNDFFNTNKLSIKFSNEYLENIEKINYTLKKESIKQIINKIKNYKKNNCLQTLKYTLNNLGEKDKDLNSIRNWIKYTTAYPGKHTYNLLSAKTILEATSEYLFFNKEEKNFVFCHIMDNHYPFNFLSNEKDDVKDEFKKLNLKYSNMNNKFYSLSKQYVDKCIEEFIKDLRNKNMLEETLLIITADHGSSFIGNINRTEITSTFFDENYRIPLIIYNPTLDGKEIENYGSSLDLIPTMLDILNEKKEFPLNGKSLFNNTNDFIIFEYYGAGCPDYLIKDKLFCIRNNNYKITYKLPNKALYKNGEIISIYNIKDDKKELINLKDRLSSDEQILKLLDKLYERIKE